jgi:transposase
MRATHFNDIKSVLRMSEAGIGYRQIGEALGMSKTTITSIMNACRENNITFATATDENSAEVMGLIYSGYGVEQAAQKPEPDWEDVHRRLTSTRHNLRSLWSEYRGYCPDGYGYSQFCYRYNNWRGSAGQLSMPQNYEPGDSICVDWAGDTVACVRGYGLQDDMVAAHFFVGVLNFSSYAHVEAFPDEKQYSWILAHCHMYNKFRGSCRLLVPDNCRTAITRASLWDPEKNPVYKELADYYNTAIVPARVRKARDKSVAEGAVKFYETWIIQKVADRAARHGAFSDFADLNRFIGDELQALMCNSFQKRPGSRLSIFTQIEKPALRPIPEKPFETMERKEFTVFENYHIPYRDHFYSVPYTLFKKKVVLVAGMDSLKIYDKNGVLVAAHQISCDPVRRYVTIDAHMPRNHAAYQTYRKYDGAYYRAQALKIGGGCYQFVDALLKRDKFEETAYRSCQAVLSSAKNINIGPARVEKACAKCVLIGGISYKSFKSILNRNLEDADIAPPNKAAPIHGNIRGPSEFK